MPVGLVEGDARSHRGAAASVNAHRRYSDHCIHPLVVRDLQQRSSASRGLMHQFLPGRDAKALVHQCNGQELHQLAARGDELDAVETGIRRDGRDHTRIRRTCQVRGGGGRRLWSGALVVSGTGQGKQRDVSANESLTRWRNTPRPAAVGSGTRHQCGDRAELRGACDATAPQYQTAPPPIASNNGRSATGGNAKA